LSQDAPVTKVWRKSTGYILDISRKHAVSDARAKHPARPAGAYFAGGEEIVKQTERRAFQSIHTPTLLLTLSVSTIYLKPNTHRRRRRNCFVASRRRRRCVHEFATTADGFGYANAQRSRRP